MSKKRKDELVGTGVEAVAAETVLERTQKALEAAERAERAVAAAPRKRRRGRKLLLLLALAGVAVVVVRKLGEQDRGATSPQPEAPRSAPPTSARGPVGTPETPVEPAPAPTEAQIPPEGPGRNGDQPADAVRADAAGDESAG